MNFLKRLFGDNDDDHEQKSSRKPTTKPRPRNTRPSKGTSLQDLKNMAQQGNTLDTKSIDELIQMIVNAPVNTDWRDAQLAGGNQSAGAVRRAWSALTEIEKRDDSQAIFDALVQHMNIRPTNLQYQRALASVGEAVGAESLLEFAKNGDDNERLNALKALAEMKAGSVAEGLSKLASDDNKVIRKEAVRALGFTGHPIAYETLKDYDTKKFPVAPSTLSTALRWCNVPVTLEEFRKRKAKGDLGIDSTLERLEEQYTLYWDD